MLKGFAVCAAACSLGLAGSAWAQGASTTASDPVAASAQGHPILEMRLRSEQVEQSGVADADALTLRTRFGWETAQWHGLKALIEVEDVRALRGDYNDGVPPAEPFAAIGDPEVTEINRAQLAWAVNPDFKATLGRQRIAFDDQRFIGNSGWRQDEQTFDGLRGDATFGQFKATYAYVSRVNRVFAEDLDWSGDVHLLNATYAVDRAFKLTGFAYLLDFDRPSAAAAQSSSTYGMRATGAITLSGVQFDYAGTYAKQADYGDNPARFDLDYIAAELNARWGVLSGRVMYESLEGDGARGFSTPLASLHPFNGWAGVFGATPAAGLKDFNVTASVRLPVSAPYLSNLALTARHHDFEAERTGADLGDEIDLQAAADITTHLSGLVKVADYDGTGAPADTTRLWVGLEFKL